MFDKKLHITATIATSLALTLLACEEPTAPPVAPTAATIQLAPAVTEVEAEVQDPCREVAPRLVACVDRGAASRYASAHHAPWPAPSRGAEVLSPADPVVIEDGMTVYKRLLEGPARRTRSHLDLYAHTPTLSADEIAYFERHPKVWEATVAWRSAKPGRARQRALKAALDTFEGDAEATWRLVSRSGIFYIEDAQTAAFAARTLNLDRVSDADTIELQRGAEVYTLERGRGGHYYHTDPALAPYRARLTLLDRVHTPGASRPIEGYDLSGLRDILALDHVEIDAAKGDAPQPARATFLDDTTLEGHIIRDAPGRTTLVLVSPSAALDATLAESRRHQEAIEGIREAVFAMVRENLFFDEPAFEEGQQDGIMRLAYDRAFRSGADTYEVNTKSYPLFDASGRPRPPQVCIDFITDAVERASGTWWPHRDAGNRVKTRGGVDMRRYMRYRQVARLVELARERPEIADLHSFDARDRVPFERKDRFFDNLEAQRDVYRPGDVVVIYGLRDDQRNHFHSFYVYETDPVFGIPTTVVDQAGHARIRSWESVMRSAPKRSIHHRVRWSRDFLLAPRSVEAADGVKGRAEAIAAASVEMM